MPCEVLRPIIAGKYVVLSFKWSHKPISCDWMVTLEHIYTWIFQICKKICLLVGFLGKKAQILHTWKIQVYIYIINNTCKLLGVKTILTFKAKKIWRPWHHHLKSFDSSRCSKQIAACQIKNSPVHKLASLCTTRRHHLERSTTKKHGSSEPTVSGWGSLHFKKFIFPQFVGLKSPV